jgi:predicted permease
LLSIFLDVVCVFAIVLLGFAANKAGWLPADSSKYLSKIVINIAGPSVIIGSLSEQNLDAEGLRTLLLLAVFTVGQCAMSLLVARIFVGALKIDEARRGIYKNFIMWTNNGFMGFPVALAIFGAQGLFYQVLVNCVCSFFLFTYGIQNVRQRSQSKLPLSAKLNRLARDIINVPVLALIIGLIILILRISLPEPLVNIFTVLGATMTPLSMMVIGIQLAESSPARVLKNHKLILVTILRLLILPAIFFAAAYFLPIPRLVLCVMTLNIMLPVAAVTVPFAEENGRDAKLAAEGAFITTLFSMLTLPVGGVFLHFFAG